RGDLLEVKTAAGSVRVPAVPYLGVRPDTIAVPMGQGHASTTLSGWYDGKDKAVQWGYGRYARAIGANALDLLPARWNAAGGSVDATRCSITKTGESVVVPSTEGSARQHGRGIAQAIDVNEIGRAREEDHEHLPGDASHQFLP